MIGMVVLSQALSFGRWNEFQDAAANHNFHALLLFLVGLGLFVVALLLQQILAELRSRPLHPPE